jgi:hypothetical protein
MSAPLDRSNEPIYGFRGVRIIVRTSKPPTSLTGEFIHHGYGAGGHGR